MSENATGFDSAFQELVRLLEKVVQAGADAVGLQWEEQDLMVVHYFGSMGRTEAAIPHNLEQAVIEKIVKRAGLASNPRGLMRLVLRRKDYDVVVDKRDNWGESEFTLTLKKSRQGAVKPASFGGRSVLESQPTTDPRGRATIWSAEGWTQRSVPLRQWEEVQTMLPRQGSIPAVGGSSVEVPYRHHCPLRPGR